jgi:hypothetical protein
MKPLNRRQRRRAALDEEHWLRFHGDPRHPRFAARLRRRQAARRPA